MPATRGIFAMACWAILGITLASYGSVSAQTARLEAQSTASYQFGKSLEFALTANLEGNSRLEEATLFYRPGPTASAQPVQVAIEPGREIEAVYTIDLTERPLPPFVTLTFWWQLQDERDENYAVAEQRLLYEDDRFRWQTLSQDPVAVHWTGEEPAVGQIALDQTVESLRRVQSLVPVQPSRQLDVYVYPSSADLRSALLLTGREWIEAHAHPELDVLMVAASNVRTAPAELGETVPHELSHLLLYRALGLAYETAPRWFDEGLATLFEDSPNANYEVLLQERLVEQDLIPLGDLCVGFPSDDQLALLAYAQSVSLVDFIQREYGNATLSRMINVLADGAGCRSFVKRGIGISLEELERSWLNQVSPASLASFWQRGAVWLVVLVAGFALMAYFAFDFPRDRHVK